VPGAGLDRIDRSQLRAGLYLANAYGHEAGIAEYTVGTMLALTFFCISMAGSSAGTFGPKYLQEVHGWAPAQIHFEHFAGQDLERTEDSTFEVRLASSGQTILVPPGRSVAAALHAHGIDLPVSCEQGVCGTCLTRVVAGEPEHRDSYLTDEERSRNDQFLPCCSRSRSACLVLDL